MFLFLYLLKVVTRRKIYKVFCSAISMARVLNLRDLDKSTVARALEKLYGRGLSLKQVQDLLRKGLRVSVEGGPTGDGEESYSIQKKGKQTLRKLNGVCHVSRTGHGYIIGTDPDNVLVNGTLIDGRPGGLSLTGWGDAYKGNSAHKFGEKLNGLMLESWFLRK